MKVNKKFLTILNGPMGSGKTTVAKIIHEQLPGVALVGKDRIKWSVSHFNRTREETRIAMAVTMAMVKEYIKNDVSVIVDQGYMFKETLDEFLEIVREFNLIFYVFTIEAPKEVLLDRINQRPPPVEARAKVDNERIENNFLLYDKNRYLNPNKTFDSSVMNPEEISRNILDSLALRIF